MAKIQNISEIHPTLGFTEFDILEKYRKSFNESELGKLHSVFPFECNNRETQSALSCGHTLPCVRGSSQQLQILEKPS